MVERLIGPQMVVLKVVIRNVGPQLFTSYKYKLIGARSRDAMQQFLRLGIPCLRAFQPTMQIFTKTIFSIS